MTNNIPHIYGAMVAVSAGLSNVPRTGKMSFGKTNYEYLKADDVQEKIHPLLVENKIITVPHYTVDFVKRGREPGVDYVILTLELQYVSAVDGSSVAAVATGEAQASDDKSINKALTQAIKNVHRATFQFPSGDIEPDDVPPSAKTAQAAPVAATAKHNPVKAEEDARKGIMKYTQDPEHPLTNEKAKKAIDKLKADGVRTPYQTLLAQLQNGEDVG